MLALHPSCTTPIAAQHGSVIARRTIRTQGFAQYFPPSLLPNAKRTCLLGIPRATAPMPAPPPPESADAPAHQNRMPGFPPGDEKLEEADGVDRDVGRRGDEPDLSSQIRDHNNNNKPLSVVEPPKKSSTVKLATVFGLWCSHIVIFNIYNKKALNLFPCPWLLASFQLLVGSLWMTALWAFRLHPYPRVNSKFFLVLLGPAFFHTVGHISASISFSKVAVSFTHVIRASEPVFSVVFSALHGHFHPIHVWLSLLPIVAGCALAAITEVSFRAEGFYAALISNAGFAMRNIYSKQSLYEFKHVDGLNLYGWISIVSLLYLFPVAVLVEGRHSWPVPAAMSSSFYTWVLLSGAFYHLYNQTSHQLTALMDESMISPLTFSVGNAMKRVVVIIASVFAFRNPVRALNALCSAIAIFGAFLYSQATARGKSKKEKIAPEVIN